MAIIDHIKNVMNTTNTTKKFTMTSLYNDNSNSSIISFGKSYLSQTGFCNMGYTSTTPFGFHGIHSNNCYQKNN